MRRTKPQPKKRQRPERVSAWKYWSGVLRAPFEIVLVQFARWLGFWFCERCDALHGPRILKYEGRDKDHPVCSLHKRTGAEPIN